MTSFNSTRAAIAVVLFASSLACPTRPIQKDDAGKGGAAGTVDGGTAGAGHVGTAGNGGHAGEGGSAGLTSGSGGSAGSSAAGTGGGGGLAAAAGAGSGGAAGTGGVAAKGTGSSCSGSDECSSGPCRDSICCPASCTLSCQGCASAVTGGANGTCAIRASNPTGTQLCENQCVNVAASDASNCGSCGHGCVGGMCSGGQCQPLSLGTPATGSAQNLVLSGGYLYAITTDAGTLPSVWQFDPNASSNPRLIASSIVSPTSPRCIMGGNLFWAAAATGRNLPTPIQWCAVSNCAATTATLLTSPGQAENPICDTTTGELVWQIPPRPRAVLPTQSRRSTVSRPMVRTCER